MTDLAIIVPAYNEAPRIGSVLDVICSYSRKKEVIVIDDGSQDTTKEVAQRYPVQLKVHSSNRGKGAALQTGIDLMGFSDYWLFLDADLKDLSHDHMDTLLRPLAEDSNLGMTIGQFQDSDKTRVDLAQSFFSILNGQRGLAGAFVECLPDLSWSRFGVEIFLSRLAESRKIPVATPVLKGISHYTKEEKFGLLPGLFARLMMYHECLRAYFSWEKYATSTEHPNTVSKS